MHPNDIVNFRETVAAPAMKRIFDKTDIPDGTCFINKLEISFLDGRSYGVDSLIEAAGLLYKDGKVSEYSYSETDVDLTDFLAAHRDCTFLSEGTLKVKDELQNMTMTTDIRRLAQSGHYFPQLKDLPEIKIEFISMQYEKMKYLFLMQGRTNRTYGQDNGALEQNTRIRYLYRDASNYKKQNECVIRGVLSPEQQQRILDCRDEDTYFIPSLVGLPEVKFDEVDDPAEDHQWFELYDHSFETTSQRASVSITADELVDAFCRCKNHWMDLYLGDTSFKQDSHTQSLDHLLHPAELRSEASRSSTQKTQDTAIRQNLIHAMTDYGMESCWNDTEIIEALLDVGITKKDFQNAGYGDFVKGYFEDEKELEI